MGAENNELNIGILEDIFRKTILSKEDEKIMKLLLGSHEGVNPNDLLGPDKVPALIYALRQGNVQAANILLQHGADKKCLNEKHPPKNESVLYSMILRTAQLRTISKIDDDVINFLFANNVNLNIGGTSTNGDDDTPMECARRIRNTLFIQKIDNLLQQKQLDPNENDEKHIAESNFSATKIIKEAGHVLGFTSTISDVHSVGHSDFETFNILKQYLENLPKSNVAPLLNKHYKPDSPLHQALDLAINWLKADGSISHQTILDHYNDGKFTILPVSTQGHSFTLLACNDILIVCNRGAGQLDNCISIFKIPDPPGKLTREFLEQIIPETTRPKLTDAISNIKKFLDIDNNPPLMVLPSNEQKHGNCALSNIKASLYPMMFLLELLESCLIEELVREDTQIDSQFIFLCSTFIQFESHFKSVQKDAKDAYKAFTEDMRNQKVNELCNAYQGPPPPNPEEKSIYLDIFKAILREHHGQTLSERDNRTRKDKMQNEKRRAEQILKILPPDEKHAILTEILTSYLDNTKASPTITWLKAQDSSEANKENLPFTPLHMHVTQAQDSSKQTEIQSPPKPKRDQT